MKHLNSGLLWALPCLLAAPLVAQTTIGGGTCSSSTLNGVYSFSLTGREVTSAGNFTNVFQANGAANFDGLSKVTITLTTDTGAADGTPLSWTGTYSVQGNCVGAVNITTGGSAAFSIALYDTGADFLITGSDSTYSYSGGGNTQPTTCPTLSGVYSFNGTGYSLSSGVVNGVDDGVGLFQFDGQGNITANITIAATGKGPSTVAVKGSYTLSSTCLGSANVTDSSGNAYLMGFSVYTANTTVSEDLYVTFAQTSKLMIAGSAHAIYGQPTATTAAERGE